MASKVVFIISIQAVIIQVFSFNVHPAMKQYLHVSGYGSQPQNRPNPISISKQTGYPQNPFNQITSLLSYLSSAQPHQTSHQQATPQQINPNYILSALMTDPYTSKPQSIPNSFPIPPEFPHPSSLSDPQGSVDANLLNNLAFLLQLFLLSSILNSSPAESKNDATSLDLYSFFDNMDLNSNGSPLSNSYRPQSSGKSSSSSSQSSSHSQSYHPSYESQSLPNANFVGTPSFLDTSPLFGTSSVPSGMPSSRGGLALMSPYEALNPSSPFSDPILSSPYGSFNSYRDFQSPYSSILGTDNKDSLLFDAFI